ncbi:MAG: hypothetical protein FWE54_01025 [Methanimicrococcus sp.]|nr:hypothetical protein [Methanimicrococcus sp.]
MKKYADNIPHAWVLVFLILFFSSFLIEIFTDGYYFFALLNLFFLFFSIYFVLKYNNKIYFNSKSVDLGVLFKGWGFYFLFLMALAYLFSSIVIVFLMALSFNYNYTHFLFLIPLFIVILPGFYLASKNFLYFKNKKMNYFPIRLFFLLPGALTFSISFLIFASIPFLIFSSYLDEFNLISLIILIILSMIGSWLTILYFKKYALKDDLPPEYQTDFMEHELYVFMPVGKKINDRASYKPYEQAIGPVRMQIHDLKISAKRLNGDIFFTKYGALIVSNKALEIFTENNLTGYQIRSILDERTKEVSDSHFQLIPAYTMPPMSQPTKLKRGLIGGQLIPDDKIYYNSVILNLVSDFNKTLEYIGTNSGSPYYHQKLWIVSHKTMEIFISQLGQNKRDFIPVMLVGSETSGKVLM